MHQASSLLTFLRSLSPSREVSSRRERLPLKGGIPMADLRARNWSFLVYPESALPDWQSSLESLHVPVAISPLHDHDKMEDGSPKKPHYHVLLQFSGKKSLDQVKEISALCSGVLPIKIESLSGAFRYLTHKDNPDKAQYFDSDLILLSGFNVSRETTYHDAVLRDIIQFVFDNQISELRDLFEVALTNPDWFVTLTHCNSYILCKLIDSNRHYQDRQCISRAVDTAKWYESFDPKSIARLSAEHDTEVM